MTTKKIGSSNRKRAAKPRPFDPWTATMDEAEAAYEAALQEAARNGEEGYLRCGEITYPSARRISLQTTSAGAITLWKEKIEGGDGLLMMWAVNLCLQTGLAAPPWLWRIFGKAVDAVRTAKVKSWDSVLGKPLPKGKHLGKRQEQRTHGAFIHIDVEDAVRAGRARDNDLFEEIGSKYGLGRERTREIYKKHKEAIRERYEYKKQMEETMKNRS